MKKRLKYHLGISTIALVLLVASLYSYLPSMLGDTIYPLKYSDKISLYAKQEGIPPAFLAGLIMAESGYNPESTSYAGAMGLVQLMPGTAKTVARELGINGPYDLHDPDTSIKLGAKHIRDMFDRYNQLSLYDQKRAVLVAYNAGSGVSDAWVRGGMSDKVLSKGVRGYIDKVMRYEDIYEMMYPKELGIEEEVVFEKVVVSQSKSYRRQFWVDLISKSLTLSF